MFGYEFTKRFTYLLWNKTYKTADTSALHKAPGSSEYYTVPPTQWYKQPSHFERNYLALLHSQLTIHSTGNKQGGRKTDDLPQRFGIHHNVKLINKRLVFWWPPLTFSWYLFFVLMQIDFVLRLRKINDHSKNINNRVMRKISFMILFDQNICDRWVALCSLYLLL